ncbi:MAG: Cna B-type domain-containing protein, partial [Bacilli bacterium]|nr:Cna B-type domain-containing protein [Bacilli bacterium]
MKHFKNLKRKISYYIFTAIVLVASIFGAVIFKADAGNEPDHAKGLTDNHDGTYKISLDVTGDSTPEIETAADVNVVLVYDVSQSMTNRINGNSGPRRADAAEKVVHDFLVDLASYQNEDKSNIQVSLVRFSVNGSQLSGWTNNINTNDNSLANMFGAGGAYNDAKLSYSNMGNQNMGTNWEHPLRLAQTLVQNKPLNGPTFVILITDGAPTKDGTSTSMGDNPTSPWYSLRGHYDAATDEARAIEILGDDTLDNSLDDATLYGIYAAFGGTEADLLDDLLYYANNGSHRGVGSTNIMTAPANAQSHNYGATEDADNYYNANETTELEGAIKDILGHVVQAMGVTDVKIKDGTTSSVKASSGTVNLLHVDEESYQYWLSMEMTPVSGQSDTYINNETGNVITFTKSGSDYVGTWTDKNGEHSITGFKESVNGKTIFKMEWSSEGNDLHSEAPTPAKLVTDSEGNGSVDWDLSSHGVLLNGVTYSVTFDVWPTQYTYDLIADLENDTVDYSDLHEGADSEYAGLDQYISKSLTGKYFLETNTKAILSYKDTRLENPTTEYSEYTNPPARELKADTIDVIKKWENNYDSATGNAIQIIVNRETDGTIEPFYDANLDFNNNYTVEDVSISTGLMRLNRETGKVSVLEPGHDYSFEEVNGQYYKWEFVAQTVHPMLINGELHELILLDEAATTVYTNQDTLETYTIPETWDHDNYTNDGTYEYVKIDGKAYVITGATPTVKAYNYRRSNLNLSKTVNGENADPDELFEFNISVDDSGLESDEKLWFSIYDENDTVIIDENLPVSSEWEREFRNGAYTGFYSAPQGTSLTVSLKAGQNLRFTNLTTQATYSITETGKDNYVFTDVTGTADYGSNHESFDYVEGTDYEVDKASRTITGGITLTNSTFSIEVENTYELASIDLTKVWDDASDQDGKRPDDIKVQIKRQVGKNGTPENYGDPITITNENVSEDDSNKWVYTIESTEELSLPRFDAEGNEYLYTVEELAVNDYVTTYSPTTVNQTDGQATYTITNKHTPELYHTDGVLEVTKHWDDFDNEDGLRIPVTIVLYKNGEPTSKTMTLTTDQDSSSKFTDLPMYEDGVEISYTIVETTTLEGYEDPDYDMETAGSFKVTNKHIPLYHEDGVLEITKVWDDVQNVDELREDVTIELYVNGAASGKTITLTTADGASDKFTDLPKYDENGDEISYTIVETTTLEGYEDPDYDMETAG